MRIFTISHQDSPASWYYSMCLASNSMTLLAYQEALIPPGCSRRVRVQIMRSLDFLYWRIDRPFCRALPLCSWPKEIHEEWELELIVVSLNPFLVLFLVRKSFRGILTLLSRHRAHQIIRVALLGSKPLSNEGMDCFLRPPLQLSQFLFHLPFQIPVRSFWSDIKHVQSCARSFSSSAMICSASPFTWTSTVSCITTSSLACFRSVRESGSKFLFLMRGSGFPSSSTASPAFFFSQSC